MVPKIIYHKLEFILSILPNKDATTPSIVNVIVIPSANNTDNTNDFFVSLLSFPTYPIISGIVDKQQGDNDVSIPPNNAKIGAKYKFDSIIRDIL